MMRDQAHPVRGQRDKAGKIHAIVDHRNIGVWTCVPYLLLLRFRHSYDLVRAGAGGLQHPCEQHPRKWVAAGRNPRTSWMVMTLRADCEVTRGMLKFSKISSCSLANADRQ